MQVKFPFQDPNLDLETRVNDLISRLTIEEKLSLIPTTQTGIPRLGIKPYQVESEAAHGLVLRDGSPTTIFPQTLGMACTWNPQLLKLAGAVVGNEARAYYHQRGERGGLTVWAPTVDLERDPRWGRTEEAYGEDPYLTGKMASAYVQGIQGDHDFYFKAVATLKHFFANNNEQDRCTCSVSIDPRNMREYYWKAFEAVVCEGKVGCIMTAYNEINGTPAILNKDVEDVVKQEWGLAGFVVADGGDFSQTVTMHQYYDNHVESIADTLKSGIDCIPDDPELIITSLREALAQGLLTEADLDRALKNIFRIRFRLGQFDPPELNPYSQIPESVICSSEHVKIALQVQRESIVLLKNDNKTLPLNPAATKKIAVIGPLADEVHMDWYAGYAPYLTTILEGIRRKLPDSELYFATGLDQIALKSKLNNKYLVPSADGILRAAGEQVNIDAIFEINDWGWGRQTLKSLANGNFVTMDKQVKATANQVYGWFVREQFALQPSGEGYFIKTWDGKKVTVDAQDFSLSPNNDQTISSADLFEKEIIVDGIKEAVAAAKAADVAIVCVGNHPLINGKEEIDRVDLNLAASQQELIRAVYQANPNTILVLVSSYPVAINWEDQNLSGIIWTTNCGQELGTGVADVLFGDYNPAGRLNMTWYRSVSQLPNMMDYDIIKGRRTYQYFTGQVLYPFGYGLSYTDFTYLAISLSKKTISADEQVTVTVKLTNSGELAGDEVVQLYVQALDSRVPRPVKQLKGFQRIHLQPQETKEIEFIIAGKDFEFWDVTRDKYCVETGFYQVMIGTSSADIRLSEILQVEGEIIPPRDLTIQTRAENYDDYAQVYLDKSKEGGTRVCLAAAEGWIAFHQVGFNAQLNRFVARVASPEFGGKLEVRIDTIDGELLGEYVVARTGGSQNWQTIDFSIRPAAGVRDLYLKFTGDLSIAWLQIAKGDNTYENNQGYC